MGRKNIAVVGLYGLNRSGNWTAKNIRKNIILPLKKHNYDVIFVGHFNDPGVINSKRSGEVGIKHQSTDHFILDKRSLETQNTENIADMLLATSSLPWFNTKEDDGQITENFLHQLHSLRQLKSLIADLGIKSPLYLLLRPDLLYLDQLDFNSIDQILYNKADLITPNWAEWGGLNDRFCFCNAHAASLILDRHKLLQDFCEEKGYVHAEQFLAYVVDKAGLRVEKTKMRAARVRANGYIVPENFAIPLHKKLLMKLTSTTRKIKLK